MGSKAMKFTGENPLRLTSRFNDAVAYASKIHDGQLRKGTGTPYIGHLLGVAAIVLEYGGDEDETIGALLHDAAEDAGGRGRLEDIQKRFGDRVAKIVDGCTDTFETPKPEWLARKEKYIAHVPTADASTLLVSAADKLYNARTILRDVRHDGVGAFQKFNGKKDGTLWYYGAIATAFRDNNESNNELIDELERVVKALHEQVNASYPQRAPS